VVTALVWVGVAALGGVGAVARFRVDGIVQRWTGSEFPFGTLAVNLVGSFALGVLAGAGVGGRALLLAGTATIGAFTTFSTWTFEIGRLAEDGEGRLALANIVVPLAAGLVFALLGWLVGRAL
jgi:CrcB protein